MAWALHILSGSFIAVSGLILVATVDILNFQKQYTAYAIFHQNPANKICHEVCVWPIVWTFYCMFHHSRPLIPALPFTNHAFCAAAMYISYYLLLESGPLKDFTNAAAGVIFACWATSGLAAKLFPRRAAYASAGINILCWVAQFYTHGKHEGRAPALTKNPAQAFFLAPLFVLLEGLADHGIGDLARTTASLQPSVEQGVKLLDAGKYAQVSQLDVKPIFLIGGIAYAACLVLLPMRSGGSEKLKEK